MRERIHVLSSEITAESGLRYRASAWGEPGEDGTWLGWLELAPQQGGETLRTDRETTQPDRRALEYWASVGPRTGPGPSPWHGIWRLPPPEGGAETMPERIHVFSSEVAADTGTRYRASVWGEQREDGTWFGWLELAPGNGEHPSLLTGRETTQPNRRALEYWATGIEPVYLEGALDRALHRRSA